MSFRFPERITGAHDHRMGNTVRGGPTTRVGKLRASRNSAVHGLCASFMVLGSERVEDYADHLETWLVSVPAGNPAAHAMRTLAADLSWRLLRLHRLEQHHHRDVLEKKLMKTKEFSTRALAQRGLAVTQALIQAAETTRPPTAPNGIRSFAEACRSAIAIIEESESPPLLPLGKLRQSVDALEQVAGLEAARAAFSAIATAATEIALALSEQVERGNESLNRLRTILADTELLVDDAEAKRLGRYRATIQQALARQVELVEAVQRRTKSRRDGKGSSFGKGVSPVILKVVK